MVYEYFRATGAYEAVQDLSTLCASSLDNDDVQDFDVKWDHALLSVSEMPSFLILEGLYKSKIENSVQLQTVMALVWSRNGANQGAQLSQIEDCCETSFWPDDENLKLQSPERCCGKRVSNQESKRKQSLRREESGIVFRHMDKVPKETHVVSVMTHKTLETEDKVRDEKDDRLLLHPIRRQNRLTAKDKHPHTDQAANRKTHWTRVTFHADSNSNSGILPCVRLQVWKRMCIWRQMPFPTCWGRRKAQQKVEERMCKGSVALFLYNWVVCLLILIREGLFYVNLECRDQNTPSNPPRAPATIKIRERKGPSWGTTFYTPIEKGMLALTSTRPEEREFVVDSGSSMHMMSKKRMKLRRAQWRGPETLQWCWLQTEKCNPTRRHKCSFTISFCFVTVQLLDETPAVLSLGKLCENPRSILWVGQRSKATIDQKWEEYYLQDW